MKYTFNLNSVLIFVHKLPCFIVEPLSYSDVTAHLIAVNCGPKMKTLFCFLSLFFVLIVSLKSSYGVLFKFLCLGLQILWLEKHKISRIFFLHYKDQEDLCMLLSALLRQLE